MAEPVPTLERKLSAARCEDTCKPPAKTRARCVTGCAQLQITWTPK
jgi:hypothetical protein